MEKKADIIPFLEGIVEENTVSYQSDLKIDERILQAAMLETYQEDRTFLWMSRPCGTRCLLEREVFLRETRAHTTWTHYDYDAEHIKAFRVIVAPGRPGAFVLGKIQPLNYGEQVQRVKQNALHVETVEMTFQDTAAPPKAPAPAGAKTTTKHFMDRARQKAKKEAQQAMAQSSKKTAKAAVDFSRKAAAATANAVKSLIGALSALVGGATLAAALCVIFLIAAVIASPFGLLFSNEPSPGAVPLNAAVTQINVELTDKLSLMQAGDYDSIDIQGTGPDWREVAAVFACKTALGADGVDVAALTPDRVDRLKAVFWDICEIASSVETIDHPASGTAPGWTEKILHITITARTADEMRTVYLFTPEQNSALTELLAELNGIGTLLGDLGISQEDAAELLRRLPEDLSPERRAVVETACKLVGKLNYFWGGKSLVLGWDSRWGTIQKVWAAGSPSTGTYRPYGMDCSGFVDWVFYNMSGGSYIIGHGGGARMQHSYCTPISWTQAQPGDLVFYPDDTHVGIVGGWDESGNIQIIHCASGQNNVVITGKAGFTTIGRPDYYG